MRTFLFRVRIYFFAAVLCAASFFVSTAHANYFDVSTTESGNLTPFKKWTETIARTHTQLNRLDIDCGKETYHTCAVPDWKRLLKEVETESLEDKLEKINDWGNAHPYIVDQLNWGMVDYWETPYELMAFNGDCEDYAIAKYYSLRAAGVPENQMRIIIVQDFNLGGIIHAILGVYEGSTLWILDNQIKQVIKADSIYHYKPVYAVNENKWWRYIPNAE
jgi:predicted transglutaminase-like cysteine proteinase